MHRNILSHVAYRLSLVTSCNGADSALVNIISTDQKLMFPIQFPYLLTFGRN
jgi:hypothetical protein